MHICSQKLTSVAALQKLSSKSFTTATAGRTTSGAVRQLVRVAKANAPVIIVYANPNRLLLWMKRLVTRRLNEPVTEPLYYFAHPLSWWQLFADLGSVELHPWRSLTAKDSRSLINYRLTWSNRLRPCHLARSRVSRSGDSPRRLPYRCYPQKTLINRVACSSRRFVQTGCLSNQWRPQMPYQ